MSVARSTEFKLKAGHRRRMRTFAGWAVLIVGLIFTSSLQRAYADGLSGTVTIDTSSLGQAGLSEIFFSMTNSNVPTSVTNTAVLSNFAFGAGGSGGVVDAMNTFGNVTSGLNLADGATVIDDQFTTGFAGFFTAGSQISFSLNLSTNVLAGGIPDNFSIYVVDPNGNSLRRAIRRDLIACSRSILIRRIPPLPHILTASQPLDWSPHRSPQALF